MILLIILLILFSASVEDITDILVGVLPVVLV